MQFQSIRSIRDEHSTGFWWQLYGRRFRPPVRNKIIIEIQTFTTYFRNIRTRYLHTVRCQWLEPLMGLSQREGDFPHQPMPRASQRWGSGRICGCGSNGSSSYQLYRSIQDGICQSWCDDGACHRHYHDLQDVYDVCLESEGISIVNITSEFE